MENQLHQFQHVQWPKKVIGKKYTLIKLEFLPQYTFNHNEISRDDIITILVYDRHVYFNKCYDRQNFAPKQRWQMLHLNNVVQP